MAADVVVVRKYGKTYRLNTPTNYNIYNRKPPIPATRLVPGLCRRTHIKLLLYNHSSVPTGGAQIFLEAQSEQQCYASGLMLYGTYKHNIDIFYVCDQRPITHLTR